MKQSRYQPFLSIAQAISLGLGMFKVTLPIAIIYGLSTFNSWKETAARIKMGGWTLIGLLVIFLFLYRYDYSPYKPELFSIEAYYFQMFFILCICAMVLGFSVDHNNISGILVLYLCLGAFVWAVCTVLITAWLSPPPYYGKIVDLRALARGILSFGNTPGIASLIIMLPVSLMAYLLNAPLKKSIWFWLGVFAIAVFSIACAVLIHQRSFFVLVVMVQPLIVGSFAWMLGRYRLASALLLVVAFAAMSLLIDHHYQVGILARQIDATLFTDARIQMGTYWINQLIANPFSMPLVGPEPLNQYPYFHSFFADIHRISGFWALCAAIALIGYIFLRIAYLIYCNKQLGLWLMATAIPIFLIMISSVVPEGEKQPFIALLLVACMCESLLSSQNNSKQSSACV
jgi:hypothetical protein